MDISVHNILFKFQDSEYWGFIVDNSKNGKHHHEYLQDLLDKFLKHPQNFIYD